MLVWGAWRDALDRAVAAHRQALARRIALSNAGPPSSGGSLTQADGDGRIRAAAAAAAGAAAPLDAGWSGAEWSRLADPVDAVIPVPARGVVAPGSGPRADPGPWGFVRIGVVHAAAGVTVPFHVPLLGHGHLAIDGPVVDGRVAGLLQAVVLRVLASSPPGSVRVIAHDPAGLGRVFAPFAALAGAGLVEDAGAGREGLLQALDAADGQVHAAWKAAGDHSWSPSGLLLVVTGLPPGAAADVDARLAALAHAGPAARVGLLIADWPPRRPAGLPPPPALEATTQLSARGGAWSPSLPGIGTHLDLPVELDPAPPPELVGRFCRALASSAAAAATVPFTDLLTDVPWTHRSDHGLATPVGRSSAGPYTLRFDDTTPHWLVGGRSGAGKTVFLLDVLTGLAVRYPPSELALYLLDFKEGVSFTEFTPTSRDPSWLPHAVAVGVESDREYGLAVLQTLRAEMARRAVAFKRAGVTGVAALREVEPSAPWPRILAVVDEFQVLFAGNDDTARQAAGLLEDIARKGRSFGVHLVLASQTAAGIEALQTKHEAVFGQFPLRVALAGGGSVLDPLNPAADGLPVGRAVVNAAGGIAGANTLVRFPDADPAAVAAVRRDLWSRWRRLEPAAAPPAVFEGFAEQHLDADPRYAALAPDPVRRELLVGRTVGIGSPTASVAVDAVPGRHLAVLGPSDVGADVVAAAVAGLARQHRPGTARFLLAPLVTSGDAAAREASSRLEAAGHPVTTIGLPQLAATLAGLARFDDSSPERPTYLVLLGAEAAGPVLSVISPDTFRPATDDLRTVVQSGPVHGVHLVGWWRSLARFASDLGPSAREDVACLLVLNVPGNELQGFLGRYDLHYDPRPHRALLLDRHDDSSRLVVPFAPLGTTPVVTP